MLGYTWVFAVDINNFCFRLTCYRFKNNGAFSVKKYQWNSNAYLQPYLKFALLKIEWDISNRSQTVGMD